MRPRLAFYSAVIALLSLASAACLVAVGVLYANAISRYHLSIMSYASLALPSLVVVVFWIWWRDSIFRVAGCFVALILFAFCAWELATFAPSGGDMDFGAPFIALVYAIGCFLLSIVGLALAGVLAFIRTRTRKEPWQVF
jgi:hypothetical protein